MQERGPVAALNRGGTARLRALAYVLAATMVVADRETTSLAVDHLHTPTHLWGPFGLALTYNSGFAFSLFSGRAVVVTVLLSVAVVVLAVLVGRARTVPQAIGGGLVLGGAIGNVSERIAGIRAGLVPDFITLTHWPTFNVADACVSVGVVILVLSLVIGSGAKA